MKFYTDKGIRTVEVPASDLRVILFDGRKQSMGTNRCTGGFFGRYVEGDETFTLPVGHTVCDYGTTGETTLHYCKERGTITGNKFRFDSGAWAYMNHLYGKKQSTLVITDGKAGIYKLQHAPEQCDYAISGVPVLRNGAAVSIEEARAEGWEDSSLYATWHVFVGVKCRDADTVYIFGMKTSTSNLVKSGESAEKFKALGLSDVIKLDGGGSYYLNTDGEVRATAENRRICTVLDFRTREDDTGLYKVQVGAFAKKANAEKLKAELSAKGYPVYIVKT